MHWRQTKKADKTKQLKRSNFEMAYDEFDIPFEHFQVSEAESPIDEDVSTASEYASDRDDTDADNDGLDIGTDDASDDSDCDCSECDICECDCDDCDDCSNCSCSDYDDEYCLTLTESDWEDPCFAITECNCCDDCDNSDSCGHHPVNRVYWMTKNRDREIDYAWQDESSTVRIAFPYCFTSEGNSPWPAYFDAPKGWRMQHMWRDRFHSSKGSDWHDSVPDEETYTARTVYLAKYYKWSQFHLFYPGAGHYRGGGSKIFDEKDWKSEHKARIAVLAELLA